MSKYFETVDFWIENLLDSTESYTIESNEKGKFVDITIKCIQQFSLNHKIFVESFLEWNKTKYKWQGNSIIADFGKEGELKIDFEKEGDLTFAISLVAREDNKDDAKVQAVKKALASEKIKEYINKELKPKGHATPAF